MEALWKLISSSIFLPVLPHEAKPLLAFIAGAHLGLAGTQATSHPDILSKSGVAKPSEEYCLSRSRTALMPAVLPTGAQFCPVR